MGYLSNSTRGKQTKWMYSARLGWLAESLAGDKVASCDSVILIENSNDDSIEMANGHTV